MHLTLVPYITAAGEIKTKPTQHSVKELRSIGIQPDILLCRCEQPLPDSERRKIALFTNVPEKAVIIRRRPRQHLQDPDVAARAGPGRDRRRAAAPAMRSRADLSEWEAVVDAAEHPIDEVTIAIVGKYVDHKDAYKSLAEALKHGGMQPAHAREPEVARIAGDRARGRARRWTGVDGILVPGGFGDRGFEGKVLAARYAREQRRSVFRHLLRHAGGGGRFRAPRRRPGRRQLQRERRAAPHPVIA